MNLFTYVGTLIPVLSLAVQAQAPPAVSVTVKDLTPKFLKFYDAATRQPAGPEQRWTLWKENYGFAAVPPTPEGQAIARKMLDGAWEKYPAALDRIRRGAAGIEPSPSETMTRVAQLLGADVPVKVTLVAFVGSFEGNAFTAPGADGVPMVAVPVEGGDLRETMTHEFTHVVEAEQAGLSLDWERSIAHTIFTEGLAMRAVQKLYPGLPDKACTGEFSPNWLSRADRKREAILADIAPHIAESDSEAVMRYTMGEGGAGIDREAYYAGWLVIGDLLSHGWTFPRLARVKDPEMVGIVKTSLARLRSGK